MKKLLLLLALVILGSTQANAQQAISVANEAITGTTVGKLAKLTGAPSTAILTGTGDLDGIVGIVVAQDATATTGNAKIAVLGPANCTFDASGVTAGHYVINSTLTAGDCADGGASRPTANQVIGRALATVASGTASVELERNFTNAGGGGSGANPTATASDVAVNGVASTFLRSDGAPAIQKTSSSVFGLAKVDGTTITASGGVITATAGGSGCTVSGGAGAVYNTGSSACTTATDQQFATGLMTLGVNTSEAGNLKLFGGTSGNVTLAPTAVAGTNVVATFPANTGTLAELNLAQTWTAKQTMTGSGPLELGANSGNVGSIKLFGNTSGDATVVVPAAAGTATRFQLPATNGANTNVLQTDGSGNTSWVAAGGGGGISCPTGFSASGASCKWTQTANNSATNIAWTGLANDNYKLKCSGLTPATASNILQIQFGEGGTPTWKVTGYSSGEQYTVLAGGPFNIQATGQPGFIHEFFGVNTYDTLLAEFSGLSLTVPHTIIFGFVINEALASIGGSGVYTTDNTAVTAIRIITDNGSGSTNGNISSGTCTLYYEAS